jgi:hypothetical protein
VSVGIQGIVDYLGEFFKKFKCSGGSLHGLIAEVVNAGSGSRVGQQ